MTETAGANVTVDGITDRPVYDYEPPEQFFAPDAAPQGGDVFNVLDFGAVADPGVDNRAAIQAAIDAAHAAGGGIVYLPAGVYGVAGDPDGQGAIKLLDNVFLKGDGIGETVVRVVDGFSGDITGIVRSPRDDMTTNYGLADLTIDGNRDNTNGDIFGFYSGGPPGGTITDQDVYILRVETKNNSGYGFDPHERTERIVIEDSVAHHNGLDGFVADFLIDAEFRNNVSYANDRHGFNIVTSSNDILLADNVAYDNGSTGIVVQRGSEDIPSPENVLITGGEIYGNAREGILIKLSGDVLVENVDIHDNGRYGVRIHGSDHVTVSGNTIRDNGQSQADGYSAVQIAEYDDPGVTGTTFTANYNLIAGNQIVDSMPIGRYGVEERAGLADFNVIEGNTVAGHVRGAYKISGENTVLQDAGNTFDDIVFGGEEADVISTKSGDDFIDGGGGNDTLSGGTGNDVVSGGEGDDAVSGNDGNDTLNGNAGNDTLHGGKGADSISGQSGDDWISADSGNDVASGGDGNDTIYGRDGADVLSGDGGMDFISGGKGDDVIYGGAGDDDLLGDSQADDISGGDGADVIDGGKGDDILRGGAGDDAIIGGSGNDTITGGAGDDVLAGNSGADTFIFNAGDGADTITDFQKAYDRVDVTAFDFTDVTDVHNLIVSNADGDAVLWLSATDSIVFENQSVSGLVSTDSFLI